MTKNRFFNWLGRLLRVLVTLAVTVAAVVLVVLLWQLYMLDPWTRDGRVRVEIVDIAPEVAGTVVKARIGWISPLTSRRLLVDSSKFRPRVFMSVCEVTELDEIITDDGAPQEEIERIHGAGVKLTVARRPA